MPELLPWREVLRRRNGLPPSPPETAGERMRRLIAEAGLAPPEQQPDHVRYGLVPLADLVAAAEQRCDLFDLPTTMCHHCKETDHG